MGECSEGESVEASLRVLRALDAQVSLINANAMLVYSEPQFQETFSNKVPYKESIRSP